MRKGWSLLAALSLFSLTSVPALADVSDYLGNGPKNVCPKAIVVRPEFSDKNVFYPVDSADLETASNIIGTAVANKYEGSSVIAAKELDRYKPCNVPVLLTKLKSYTREPAILGQHTGKMSVSILRFQSPSSDAPDKTIDVTATGERHWGDSVPFMNAAQAVTEKIRKTSF